MNYTEILEHLLSGPAMFHLKILTLDGVELRPPIIGLISADFTGYKYIVWEYHPEVPPGVPGGCVRHLTDAVIVPRDQVDDSLIFTGTWTGAIRIFVPDSGGILGSLQYSLGEGCSPCHLVVSLK
jgi:hypothetical protein